MVWFNVDDGFTTSPKVLSIPRASRMPAVGLWTMAGSWSAKHLTDGAVPAFMLEEWGADVSLGTCLVDAGLWRETAKGYQFQNWKEYQQARSDVEDKRERERERKKAYREKMAGQKGDSATGVPSGVPVGQTEGHHAESDPPIPSLPIPTKPTPIKGGAAKRGTRIAEPFMVTAEMRSWAATRVPLVNVDRASERFVNHWRAKTGKDATKLDWVRTWQNWLLKDQEDAERRPQAKASPTERALSVIEMGRRMQAEADQKGISA